jgi:hypothetical protein
MAPVINDVESKNKFYERALITTQKRQHLADFHKVIYAIKQTRSCELKNLSCRCVS